MKLSFHTNINHSYWMTLRKIWAGKKFKTYVLILLSRAPAWKRDRLLPYSFEYMFLTITFEKTCARFFRKQTVYVIINFIDLDQFWLMESFVKIKSSFDTNNFMKNVHTVFKNNSLRACVPNFKVQVQFLQKLEFLGMKKLTKSFIQTYTAKAPFTFLEECFCAKGNAQFRSKSDLWTFDRFLKKTLLKLEILQRLLLLKVFFT